MNLGPFAVAFAVAFLLLGLGYLVSSGRGPRPGREVPPNLQPYLTNDELETSRLNKTLVTALFSSAFLALALPIYFATEAGRQEDFTEKFEEEAIHIGENIYNLQSADNPEGFGCIACHGAEGVGGGASFVDARTGTSVTWDAPAINDVFYRYDRDEVRYWLIWGRSGSPMPAWGIEAGGPLNSQQINFVMDYLESIQIPQEEALDQVDLRVEAELAALESAPNQIESAIAAQQAQINLISTVGERFEAGQQLAEDLAQVLDDAENGFDTDRDGLSDDAETQINRISELAFANVGSDATVESQGAADRLVLELDPDNPFTTADATGEPVPDAQAAALLLDELNSQLQGLGPLAANQESILASTRAGLAALEQALADQRFAVDFDEVAAAMGTDLETAQRAYGLYSAYCARCHTAGYSAGPVAQLEPGSGALGPSLRDRRSVIQFPDEEDHVEFIINGAENGIGYGVNGIGRGWMPGFGATLTEADIRLIVAYERSLD